MDNLVNLGVSSSPDPFGEVNQNTAVPIAASLTTPGRQPGMHTRLTNLDISEFDWGSYPETDENGRILTDVFKFEFNSRDGGRIFDKLDAAGFFGLSGGANLNFEIPAGDIVSIEKRYRRKPVSVFKGIWHYQKEKTGPWIKVDRKAQGTTFWLDITEEYYSTMRPKAYSNRVDPYKEMPRPYTETQIRQAEDQKKEKRIKELEAALSHKDPVFENAEVAALKAKIEELENKLSNPKKKG